jgi:hypothetical protein
MKGAWIMAVLFPVLALAAVSPKTLEETRSALLKAGGQENLVDSGLAQMASQWTAEDGTDGEFAQFAREQFIIDPGERDLTFQRLDRVFEILDGDATEMGRTLKWGMDVEAGPLLKADSLLAEYDPSSHFSDDMFKSKLAFFILLNFEAPTLEKLGAAGESMDRAAWARARLAQRFADRVPASIQQDISRAFVRADDYINNYNFFLGSLRNGDGKALYPAAFGKLISHWGLRDELKAQYKNPDGLARQKLIYDLMLRIITQKVPVEAINNPGFIWNLSEASPKNSKGMEPDTRYAVFLDTFNAIRKADPYSPVNPTYIARKFNREREIPEPQVEALLTGICASPLRARVAEVLRKKLGRPLEPFDLYYTALKAAPSIPEAELDRMTAAKYKGAPDFQKDIPAILRKLGFSPADADFIAAHIQVDPSRGIGHAMGAQKKDDFAHLRTRVPAAGMNYKGFNIAMHELGHNVEQVISNSLMDYHSMNGVPNTAFTEAFAFLFQGHDLEMLGLTASDPNAEALDALNEFWMTYEIAGVALVDMRVWHWMYEHPDATPARLKEAVIRIADEVWNAYYADVFKVKDTPILAVYSHMINSGLYLPDYPLGHVISFQLKEYMKGKVLGVEMPRMCRQGVYIPNLWMKKAVGSPVSAGPMLKAAEAGLKVLDSK